MLGSQFDFEMHRGDSRVLRFIVVDTADPPVAVDLTGFTSIKWALTKRDTVQTEPAPLGAALVEKDDVGGGVVVEDVVNGIVRVDIAEADTTTFQTPADFYYEVQIELGGDTSTVLFGIISLKRDRIAPGP